jgi:hypothetical protein
MDSKNDKFKPSILYFWNAILAIAFYIPKIWSEYPLPLKFAQIG